LLADRPDAPVPKRIRWATHVLAKSRLLNRLINEVLDLSRLNVRHFDLKMAPFDLAAHIRRVLEEQRLASDHHELHGEFAGELSDVLLDADRIDQLLSNLIINAIKYSPEGGAVTVRVERTADAILIDVKDEGIGIPAEYYERIFEPFFRVDNSTTREVYGTGLGLPLCRGIARAHGGDITLESEVGAGTTFHVRLPLALNVER
ncbi:MAG: sensor histidine kinase, partial [Ardenticatenaceae bacterium]